MATDIECSINNADCDTNYKGLKMCKYHTAARRNRVTSRRERLIADGKCPTCAGPNDGDMVNCSDCRARHRDHKYRRMANGMCGSCTNTAIRHGYCEEHANYLRAKKSQYKIAKTDYIVANNLCRLCGENQRLVDSARCADCARWNIAEIHGDEDADRITCPDAAKILGCARTRVYQIVELGRLDVCATKPQILVTRKSVMEYARNRGHIARYRRTT